MKDKEKEFYEKVMSVINKGYNVEIQKKPDGTLKIYQIKRNIVM